VRQRDDDLARDRANDLGVIEPSQRIEDSIYHSKVEHFMIPFAVDEVDIVFAEDDPIFQEISIPTIARICSLESHRILLAGDGRSALVHLRQLQSGPQHVPILLLLDVRMPGMDGLECACVVRHMAESNQLRRLPFVVCCSSALDEVVKDRNTPFHIHISKPLTESQMQLVLEAAQAWWRAGRASGGRPAPALPLRGGAGSSLVAEGDHPCAGEGQSLERREAAWDLSKVDMIVGDSEAICRMSLQTSLMLLGASEERIQDCEDTHEVEEAIRQAQECTGPLMVFLGTPHWMERFAAAGDNLVRPPFWVSTNVDGVSRRGFSACLPARHTKEDLRLSIEKYQLQYSRR